MARTGRTVGRALGLAVALVLAGAPRQAFAQGPDASAEVARLEAEAREAEVQDPTRAARLYEKADRLAPDPNRLAAAILAATAALEPTLAMTLVVRAEGRPSNPVLDLAVARAQEKFSLAVATIRVRCGACVVTIDGKPGVTSRKNVVPAGAHVVEAGEGANLHRWSLSLGSGEEREVVPPWLLPSPSAPAQQLPPQIALAPMGGEVTPPPRPPAQPRAEPGPKPLGPEWFWGGVALTAATTWATTVSGIDAIRDHDRLDRKRDFFSAVDARRADYRTTILGAAAVGCALGTAAIGIFAVDFGGGNAARATLRGSTVELDASF